MTHQTRAQKAAQQESAARARRGPWQALDRVRQKQAENDERHRNFEEAGAAGREQLMAAVRHPERDNSPEAIAARSEASRLAGMTEADRRRAHQGYRASVAQEAEGCRNALAAAAANHDTEGYLAVFDRLQGLKALLNDLDSAETTRQQMSARPFFAGTAQL